ncbi:MAG: four helix bundle protein, partial [Planctomycetaceae bacterium]
MKRRASDDLLVLTKTYDLLLWYTSHISRFPRQHRYSLGQRIEKHLFRVLESLTAARDAGWPFQGVVDWAVRTE